MAARSMGGQSMSFVPVPDCYATYIAFESMII